MKLVRNILYKKKEHETKYEYKLTNNKKEQNIIRVQ